MRKKMSKYRYGQLRKIVKSAKVRAPVKELLFCTLKDYYKQNSVPADGVFQDGKNRCLIGAALHDKTVLKSRLRGINVDEQTAWVEAAKEAFNVEENECDDIITGFDTSNKIKAGSRVTKIANQLREELIGFDDDYDDDKYDNWL